MNKETTEINSTYLINNQSTNILNPKNQEYFNSTNILKENLKTDKIIDPLPEFKSKVEPL